METNQHSKPNKLLGFRHVQFLLLFAAIVIGYGMRTNLSMGIVAILQNDTEKPNLDIPTYPEWEEKKNLIQSSFFWGYICLQVFAGELAQKYGPKWFLGAAMGLCSVASICIPVFAQEFGYVGVIICRVVQGLTQGFLFPSAHSALSRWTPIPERSKVGAFVYTGGPLGTVISMPVTGLISKSSKGWPAAFYLYGGLGLAWTLLWFLLGSNSPANHKFVSSEELSYIQKGQEVEEKVKSPTPWKQIACSLPMSAIIVAQIGQNWGFWTLMTEIPTYLDKILKFSLGPNSLLTSLPYLALWLLSFIMSPTADYLINNNKLSIGITRKLFNSIGVFIPALTLVCLSFVKSSQKELAVSLLVIAVGINSGVYSGYNVNHIDIAPNHSGTLMGITNGFSNIVSIIAPLAVDGIKSYGYEETDSELWMIVFCLAAGIYVITGLYYIIFASGEIQAWNDDPRRKTSPATLKT